MSAAGPGADGPGGDQPSDAARTGDGIGALRGAKVGLLTSYRRDGTGVGTPVAISVEGGRAYFTTRSRTWKVKRIARDPRVTLAPCRKSGKVLGPPVRGVAERLADADAAARAGGLRHRVWTLVYRLVYRDVPVSYVFTPRDGEPPGEGGGPDGGG